VVGVCKKIKRLITMVTDSAGMLELTNSSILSGCMSMLGEFIWYLALSCKKNYMMYIVNLTQGGDVS